jgi:transposase InsO family protein
MLLPGLASAHCHAYIKRGTPQLNGKVERSHRSDQQEFYQLLSLLIVARN